MALSEICSLCFATSIASTTSSAEDIHCYHNLALLMISFTPNETIKHKLLTEVVFNKTIHAIESSGIAGHMSELSLRDKEFEPNIVDNLDSIKTLYGKHSRFDSHHWLFDPLIRSVETKNSVTLDEIRACLVFISAVVKRHRNYCQQLIQSSSAFYCLISSVFLISEEVFFDDGVQRLLYVILKTLLAGDGIRCQISDRVPYYDTCGDFYQRFVDQLESVSYGNKLFINYLLVFCQSKCSPLFRTKLFVDFPTAFRIIQISFEEWKALCCTPLLSII
ncbi:unnamed protein product [Medioppia subpectinata]|uniref:RPAP1/MINIYO-like TPR repeats domain-containing protein n=1 Tax=Medioppia subpectinata TaxID=1979941 RepID=A0A7R9QIH7_9ACAR|nr:unnamed protein product [Medioppia subpectinata]CAG2121206.1 unnamed protein product [Medioppia subpectinata]